MSFQTLHADIIGERARLTPGKTALVDLSSGLRLSYQELNERARRCGALWLGEFGLRRGDRVGILCHNRLEFLDAFFAAAKTGIILVPLSTRLTERELRIIVAHSGMRALHFGGEFPDLVRALRVSTPIAHWLALDGPGTPGDLLYGGPTATDIPARPEHTPCGPEDVCCLLYTSGTTGQPKGVMIPHRMVAWNAYNTAMCWQLREEDISPVFTPLYHAGGLGAFLMPIFAIGGTIVLHRRFDAAEVWRVIERERCTVALGVPTIYRMLMDVPEFAAVDLSSVRWLISGGAPLPLYIIQAYQKRGVVLKQGYGLTEVGVNCFSMTIEESMRKAGSIGKPMMFTEARLVGTDGECVPPGQTGELHLRGPHVCRGYWQDPAATGAALDPDGWFHTGDLARRDEEGFYTIAGRSKDLIISGGVNIYPAEIEGELLLHPGIEDVAVTAVPDESWGEAGVAFVVARRSGGITAEELKGFLEIRLARYKIPKDFVFLEALPRTPYGKVIKGELRDRYTRCGKE